MRRSQNSTKRSFLNRIGEWFQWLLPGLGVKRWLLVILIGTTLVGLGFAVSILDLYRNAPGTWWGPILRLLSLQRLDRAFRALIFGGFGLGTILFGIWGLNRALLKPFVRPGKTILETVTAYRKKERGPRIVVIGGGTGLSALLRGLKAYSSNLTAVVTVADDGGSSGELRKSLGILPPGDIRNCLIALSEDEALLSQVFQYRFANAGNLSGHSFGNLFISALTEITGSFEEAVAESGRVLAVQGQVLPATLHDVRLVADITVPLKNRDVHVKGESSIPKAAGQVRRVWLEPSNPLAFPPAIQAILNADLILVGPGSLYTSLLPNLLVPDLAAALRASRALKFYICNVATQPGETDGFTCGAHVHTIEKHMGGPVFDLILCNDRQEGNLPESIDWTRLEPELKEQYSVYQTDLVDVENPWRHDSLKLARTIMDLYNERTGPLAGRDDSL
ncbi:conserved hypothetical protein, cofD-related [Longilinea arvoryzae]|uniref:Putative gluconeogenesis factor n=1 Tax=Longilinea arvoryzae TaxID=360412 RepID=A0A0S7BGG7_9CHLR|nr:uridine diphosphate-N-acetylglucosamine-binding protein YvcK [Longilinea arvoryzae]GAP14240.1 conserved hypothetical protein, cofD-related [Longilinea arvoryzae]